MLIFVEPIQLAAFLVARGFSGYRCRTVRRALRLVLGLSALLFTAAPPLLAQSESATDDVSPGAIVTDRPTASASPVVVPDGTFQFELGYLFSRVEDDSGSTDVQLLPDLLMRFGINETVEARVVAQGWTTESGAGRRTTGFSDISLGAKIALTNDRGPRPQMALLVDVSLPVGDSDFTNGYVIPKVLFLGASGLTDNIWLTYNIGPSFITEESGGDSETNINLDYALALSGSVGGPFSLFGEFFGTVGFGTNRMDRHDFQAGTTILLSPLFQIDIRAGLGLTDNGPDFLIGAGLAFRIPF